MRRKHKVRINIADTKGNKQMVLENQCRKIPKRLLKLLFGDFCEVIILNTGKSVEGFELTLHTAKAVGFLLPTTK